MILWLQSKHGLEEEKMDYLSMRLHTFESENERLKTESLRLKTENEKLKLVGFTHTTCPPLNVLCIMQCSQMVVSLSTHF